MAIVTESYRQWLLFETRTDDITCMVIQITGLENAPGRTGARMSIGARLSQMTRRSMSQGSVGAAGQGLSARVSQGSMGAGDETTNDRRVISKPKRRHVIESGVFGAGLGAAGGGGDIMDTTEMDGGEVGPGRYPSPRHRMPLTH